METRQLEGVPKYEDEVELCKQFLLEVRAWVMGCLVSGWMGCGVPVVVMCIGECRLH